MKHTKLLQLWSKTDIAVLLGCEVSVLSDIITEKTKKEIGFSDKHDNKNKKKKYKLKDIYAILHDVYPFLSEEQRLNMIIPNHYATNKVRI